MGKAFKLVRVHEQKNKVVWMNSDCKRKRDELVESIVKTGAVCNIQKTSEYKMFVQKVKRQYIGMKSWPN